MTISLKKSLTTAAVLASISLSATASNNVTWQIKVDEVNDGVIDNQVQLVDKSVRIANGHFYFDHQSNPNVVKGWLEPTNIPEIGSGTTSRIEFVVQGPSGSYRYLGAHIGGSKYRGAWFGPNGRAGDFEVDTNPYIPQGVVIEPVSASVTHSVGNQNAAALHDGQWSSNHSSNNWSTGPNDASPSVTYDMGIARPLASYRMVRGYCSLSGYLAGTWTVEASNDQQGWQLVDEVTEDQSVYYPNCDDFGPDYQMDSTGDFRYYKFTFTASPNSVNSGISLGELQVLN